MRKYTAKTIKIPVGNGTVKAKLLTPKNRRPAGETAGILWIHGGGYATGMAGMVHISRAASLAGRHGAVVIAPEYRLSGRHPWPDGLEDCRAALRYLYDRAEDLGFSRDLLMVGGESAGGGMTAALCMAVRGEIPVAFQMPLYPMLDDRDTESSRCNHGISWGTRRNHAAWKLYLRRLEGKTPPPTAVPARETDLSGLPPAYTFVGDREPFYRETLNYVDALNNAGVPAQADVYPTGLHAFDMLLPFRKISRQAAARFEAAWLARVQEILNDR